MHVSQAPVLEGSDRASALARAHRRPARVRGARRPSGYVVMPGGLTRVAGDEDSRVISMQRGGARKDTWVLAAGAGQRPFSLLSQHGDAPTTWSASDATLSSRAAENLFWFGRYGERCDASARLLRVALGQVLDDSARDARRRAAGLGARASSSASIETSREERARAQLRRAATHPGGGARAAAAPARRASPSACATACRSTTGARSTA